MRQLKIGDVTLDNPIILAPMAGVTDLPFRLLCREQGAGLVCMEMVSAKAIYYQNKNTEELLTIHPKEVPASLQLFGSDPEIMSEMAKQIEEKLLETTKYTAMEMHYSTDAAIIGGLVIRIGDHVVDSSIATKLNELKKQLMKIQLA